ncbi:MAG: hypothetical protein LRS48_00250 [Desulfurococcales archaeon]|nr:hypothetical protein [Desulfurococcales archaeon]
MGEVSTERLIRKWALKLADELAQLGRTPHKSIRSGDLSDALDEARQVLMLANMEDLAAKAATLKSKVDSLKSEIGDAGRSSNRYLVRVKIAPTKEEVLKLASDIKERAKLDLELLEE